MKYTKPGNETFTTKQMSIEETITEADDVIAIAQDIIKNITDVSVDTKKELDLALNNLNQATIYLEYLRCKTDIALKHVPVSVQEKEYL